MQDNKITSHHKFNKISIFSAKNLNHYKKNQYLFHHLIPLEWRMLLMSDGSFTQSLYSLTNQKIHIVLISKQNYKQTNNLNNIRHVLLQDENNINLAFAKSLWLNKQNQSIEIPLDQPIGKSLIKFKTDIHKEIHEIYYGYCQYLNILFKCSAPIWGRKYTIYHKNKPLTIIEEIFSPHLIKFFKQY